MTTDGVVACSNCYCVIGMVGDTLSDRLVADEGRESLTVIGDVRCVALASTLVGQSILGRAWISQSER